MEAELTEWKSKYAELHEECIAKQNSLNTKEFENKSLSEKQQRLQSEVVVYREKSEMLSNRLREAENEMIELNNKHSAVGYETESKLQAVQQTVHALQDELAESEDKLQRVVKMKEKTSERLQEREEQLKQSNMENDKLMDTQYELKESINKLKEEMICVREQCEKLSSRESESAEQLASMTDKLERTTLERDKLLKKSVRLNNRISSLEHENSSLQDSISHLESVIDDTYGLAEDKDRKLDRLKRVNNETQLHLNKLKKRMDRSSNQARSYREFENEKISKKHRKMDQKLDMVRKSNLNLQQENDELTQDNNELKQKVADLQSQINEQRTKHKSSVNKYQSEISKLKASSNKVISDRMEKEADLDNSREENSRLSKQLNALQAKYKRLLTDFNNYKLQTRKQNKLYQRAQEIDVCVKLEIHEDSLYQFIERCRNIFINTNKLTPKLIKQLIEASHKILCIFYESKSKFLHMITQCDDVHTRFHNLHQSIWNKYEKHPWPPSSVLKMESMASMSYSALQSVESPIGSASKKRGRSSTIMDEHSSSSFRLGRVGKAKKGDKHAALHSNSNSNTYAVSNKIRQPIQSLPPAHFSAFEEIYAMSVRNVLDARHDLQCIAQKYLEPLDYSAYSSAEQTDAETRDTDDSKYHEVDDEQQADKQQSQQIDVDGIDESAAVIDYDDLLIDPSSQRYEYQQMKRNHEKFDSVIERLQSSAKELRSLHTKSNMELDVAWHAYYLSPDVYGDDHQDGKTENDAEMEERHKRENAGSSSEDEYDMNSDLETDTEYIKLIKKVNKPSHFQKRFSII